MLCRHVCLSGCIVERLFFYIPDLPTFVACGRSITDGAARRRFSRSLSPATTTFGLIAWYSRGGRDLTHFTPTARLSLNLQGLSPTAEGIHNDLSWCMLVHGFAIAPRAFQEQDGGEEETA